MANGNPLKNKKNKFLKRVPFNWIIALVVLYFLISSLNMNANGVPKEMTYSSFYKILKEEPRKIKSLVLTKVENELKGEFVRLKSP